MLPLRLAGINMSDDASETFSGGVRAFLGSAGFLTMMFGGYYFYEGKGPGPWWMGYFLIGIGLPLFILPAIWKKLRRAKSASDLRPLEYLSNRDSDLSEAIIRASRSSAYGRWFAAQYLAGDDKKPIQVRYLLHVMSSQVFEKMLDGEIEVRGRRPGKMDYELIPRTHWRSSAFFVVENNISLWRIVIAPRGSTQIDREGAIVSSSHPASLERTEQLRDYDSLIVDAHQFEMVFPRKDKIADKYRRRFLLRARWRGLDKNEIKRLC